MLPAFNLQGHDEHVTKLRQDFERQVKGLQTLGIENF